MRKRITAGVAAALVLTGAPAEATFDEATGRVRLDGYPISVAFDDLADLEALGPTMYLSRQLAAVRPASAEIARDPARVLEGQGALRYGRSVWASVTDLDVVAPALRGQAVRVTVWIRPEGTVPAIDLIYAEAPLGFVDPDPERFFDYPGVVRLQPTGRATDDGWRELSTGVVDFTLSGAVEARALRVVDQRLLEVAFFGISRNPDGEAWLDGLSVEVMGPKRVPDVACTLADERDRCGLDGACLFGRCADGHAALGHRSSDVEVRRDYAARLGQRMAVLAGSREAQRRAAGFADEILAAAETEHLAAAWSRHRRAFDDLADGHVSAPRLRFEYAIAPPACLYLGRADLLPAAPTAPLVFEVAPGSPLAGRVQVGDALVAIDGLSPEDWAEAADRYLRYAGDPAGRRYAVAPQLLTAAIRTGATLSFARCRSSAGCTPQTVERFEIRTVELTAPLWSGAELSWRDAGPRCDFRFRRDVEAPEVRESDFVGARQRAFVRTVLINGVPGFGDWRRQIAIALDESPPNVLLDQRTGGGGTFQGVSAVLEPFLRPDEDPWVMLVPQLVPDGDVALVERLRACQFANNEACGGFLTLPLGLGIAPRGGVAESALAVVNGYDVSGNDYLARALRDRAGGRTRVFGPGPTFGAFGPIYSLPRLMGELYGGSVQLHDTAFQRDAFERNLDFTTGTGVPPDVVVLQQQSDLLRGVDTVLEAARGWLRGATP